MGGAPIHKTVIVKFKHLPKDNLLKNQNSYGTHIRIRKRVYRKGSKGLESLLDYVVRYKDFVFTESTIPKRFGKSPKKTIINGQEFHDCYELEHSFPDRITDSTCIKKVYWTNKYGLTAYSNGNGETWLINP